MRCFSLSLKTFSNPPPHKQTHTHTKTHLAGGLGHVARKRELLKVGLAAAAARARVHVRRAACGVPVPVGVRHDQLNSLEARRDPLHPRWSEYEAKMSPFLRAVVLLMMMVLQKHDVALSWGAKERIINILLNSTIIQ